MSIISAITTPLSQLPLWRKKSKPLGQSEPAPHGMIENDREEDGFTFVGESESERNTVYPGNVENSCKSSAPPSYQQASIPCSTLYHAGQDATSATTPHMQGTSMEEFPHKVLPIKDCIADVPFTLAPYILDPAVQDTSLDHCLSSTELSRFVYDFSVEKQVLSCMEQGGSEIGHDIKSNHENPPFDECNNTEEQILQQYGA